jgi:hypothetical protein
MYQDVMNLSDEKWLKQQEKQEKKDERKWLKQQKKLEKKEQKTWLKSEKKLFNVILDEEVKAIKEKDILKIKELKELEEKFLKDKDFRKGYIKGRKEIEKKHIKFYD